MPVSPRLVAAAGPLKGSTCPLTEEQISIGRDLSNEISIGDGSVSRKHSLLTRDDSSYRIQDLKSLNGTFVNDVPILERLLQHGDSVRIGTSLFFFLVEEHEQGDEIAVCGAELRLGSTLRLRAGEGVYVDAPALTQIPPSAQRMAGDLRILLEASRVVGSSRNTEDFARKLLGFALEAAPADRGAVLLRGETSDEIEQVFGRDASGESTASFPVSRTLLAQVLHEKEAVLCNEVLADEQLREAKSLLTAQVRALLAVPLAALGRTHGVLYLDSKNPAVAFDEGQLQLLFGLANLAAAALPNVRRMEWLEAERQRLDELRLESGMVGESARMKQVREVLARVAPTDSTLLILGETGTGKELAARAIHANSSRSGGPFLAVNCAALTETLLESELFGHERGAFTGAIAQKKGKFEIADRGTVFLDEVAELTLPIQAKLLRALEERQFERLGGTRPIRVDVRLIAATNKNLEEAIRAGQFREDLFYRLHVISVTMPPLRERVEDIPLLASFFVARFASKLNRKISGFSAEAHARLTSYEWPGNVRELSNAIERAVVLCEGDVLRPEDLPESLLEAGPAGETALPAYHEALNETKRRLIREAVEAAHGNYTEAAKRLGLHPNYLHRLIRNLGMKEQLRR